MHSDAIWLITCYVFWNVVLCSHCYSAIFAILTIYKTRKMEAYWPRSGVYRLRNEERPICCFCGETLGLYNFA